MHIWEGVLSQSALGTGVLVAGAALTAAGTAIALRKLDYEQVPRVAVLSSTFFVVSLIQVPLGPASEHLTLNGLVGLVLGWAAFPAMLIALFLQAALGVGGLTALGVNTLNMALPAVACYYLFNRAARNGTHTAAFWYGFAAGAIAILASATMTALTLLAAGDAFRNVSLLMLLGHLPLAVIEGLVTGSVVVFLRKVQPELLAVPETTPEETEVA
ncbi:MAG: cobalt transporter CbiM [Pirellulales bacterium]